MVTLEAVQSDIAVLKQALIPGEKIKALVQATVSRFVNRRTNSFMSVVSNVAQMIIMVGDVNCRGSTDPQTQRVKTVSMFVNWGQRKELEPS